MKIVVLPPLFLPPRRYFELMAEADLCVIDVAMPFNKRNKALHRTILSGQQGAQQLTVSICKPRHNRDISGPSKPVAVNQILPSGHGEWWRVHRATLETLYGATPWFHLFKTDILDKFSENALSHTLVEFNIALILAIRKLAHITTPLTTVVDPRLATGTALETNDYRHYDFYADASSRSVIENLFNDGRL